MAYDEELADRVREVLVAMPVTEQKMFGGLAFLVDGHMAVAVSGQGGLMVRVDPATSDDLLESTPAEAMVMRGRPLAGWLRVASAHVATASELTTWVERGTSSTRSLPPKQPGKRAPA